MSDRYGAASPARRRLVILVSGLVGLVALAWVAWATWFETTPDVQSSLRTFSVVDEHTVKTSVGVHLSDEGVVASCKVRAYGRDHSIVGELNFKVTGETGTRPHDVTFRTEREATSVEVVGCTTKDQARPR